MNSTDVFLKGNSYDKLYLDALRTVLEDGESVDNTIEITNLTMVLTNPAARMVFSRARKVNYEFAMKLAIWIINGDSDAEYLLGINPNAASYLNNTSDKEFDTAYGPRFLRQVNKIVAELERNIYSRRCVIQILNENDQSLLGTDTKTEYPCTNSLTFLIRDGKLDMYVDMRSNNMVTTVVYDVFVFTLIQELMLAKLKLPGDLELGTYTHRITSAHIYENDMEWAESIVKDCHGESKTLFIKRQPPKPETASDGAKS